MPTTIIRRRCCCLLPMLLLTISTTSSRVAVVSATDDSASASHDTPGDIWKELARITESDERMDDIVREYKLNDQEELRRLAEIGDTDTTTLLGEGGTMGQRCGNNNPCAEISNNSDNNTNNSTDSMDLTNAGELECTSAGLGKRCLPKSCLEQKLEAFHQTFDIDAYKATILQTAGVTESELLKASGDGDGDGGGGSRGRDFVNTDIFQAVKQALDQHSAPAEAIFQMYKECDARVDYAGVTYTGIHFEAGFFLDGALDIFWQYQVTDSPTYIRWCIGLGVGGGAEMSFLYLMAQDTDDPAKITETCSVVADVDFAFPLASGVAYGCGLNNGLAQLEITLGAGIGASAGVSFCGVSQS